MSDCWSGYDAFTLRLRRSSGALLRQGFVKGADLIRVTTAAVRPFMQRGQRLALTGGIVLAVVLTMAFAFAQRAVAITPVIVNNGATQWTESLAVPGEDTSNNFRTTVLVRHDPGRSVTGLRVDKDFNGNDDTGSAGIVAVTSQQPVVINGFTYSR